ncbi:transducin beta-like protein 3 isoform X1 [Maniola hyperantus]|uniref:transducin beta-like protein 3 isoform X1 n=2 Tax=Aphantopus hyperantus TaxID=2795564 RepID=UPI00156A101E|nr:transducin beta-like protein 3 [Maniola hyperantus]
MASSLKEVYEKTAAYEAFYTGGDVQWTADGGNFLCQCNDVIKVIDVSTFCNTLTIGDTTEDKDGSDQIYTFKMSHDNKTVITAHKSGLIKLWDKETGKQQKVWRSGHKGAVAKLAFDSSDANVASGGTDGNIRLWDIAHNTCTSSLKGALGVFTVLKYHPDSTKPLVFGAADDTKIRSWDSNTGKDNLIYCGHFSKVTSLQFTSDGEYMISSGRDRVLILWKLGESKSLRVVPVYESIETTILMPPSFKIPNFKKKLETEGIYVACAGEKGVVKIWNVQMSRLMYEQSDSLVSPATEEGGLAVTHLQYNEARNMLSIATADHNIIIHDLETFKCVKQMIGFTDEILDIIFVGKDETHIVVATNSRDLKLYELSSMNCKLIKGHTDIVLALANFPTRPNVFVSSGKDNSVRVWFQDEENEIKCFGIGARHTGSVGSVFTSQISDNFFASVSQDNCLKVWVVPKELDGTDQKIKSSHTELAHNMDINCVAVSPNDKIIATGSQDKTAKLWTEDLSLLGILKGHRRGIWCVRFSSVDQVVLTASADCTLKLWSIADLSCLKTFEGHESSVLKMEFLSKGQQIVSSGADGLLKLWDIKTSECKMSLDNHDGKVWSLAVNKNESLIITGGSDSKLVTLKDVSMERREILAKERESLILQEQELMNLLHDKKLVKALKLALRMERPLHVLKIVSEVLKFGQNKLSETLKEINNTQKETLLRFATEWNTNNKNCQAAQFVFYILAPEIISGSLQVPSLASLVESSLPYTERHFERLTNILQDLNFISYTVNCIQPHAVKNVE